MLAFPAGNEFVDGAGVEDAHVADAQVLFPPIDDVVDLPLGHHENLNVLMAVRGNVGPVVHQGVEGDGHRRVYADFLVHVLFLL